MNNNKNNAGRRANERQAARFTTPINAPNELYGEDISFSDDPSLGTDMPIGLEMSDIAPAGAGANLTAGAAQAGMPGLYGVDMTDTVFADVDALHAVATGQTGQPALYGIDMTAEVHANLADALQEHRYTKRDDDHSCASCSGAKRSTHARPTSRKSRTARKPFRPRAVPHWRDQVEWPEYADPADDPLGDHEVDPDLTMADILINLEAYTEPHRTYLEADTHPAFATPRSTGVLFDVDLPELDGEREDALPADVEEMIERGIPAVPGSECKCQYLYELVWLTADTASDFSGHRLSPIDFAQRVTGPKLTRLAETDRCGNPYNERPRGSLPVVDCKNTNRLKNEIVGIGGIDVDWARGAAWCTSVDERLRDALVARHGFENSQERDEDERHLRRLLARCRFKHSRGDRRFFYGFVAAEDPLQQRRGWRAGATQVIRVSRKRPDDPLAELLSFLLPDNEKICIRFQVFEREIEAFEVRGSYQVDLCRINPQLDDDQARECRKRFPDRLFVAGETVKLYPCRGPRTMLVHTACICVQFEHENIWVVGFKALLASIASALESLGGSILSLPLEPIKGAIDDAVGRAVDILREQGEAALRELGIDID